MSQRITPNHQALLEAWLPLVQAMNREFGWGLAAPSLEQVIIDAAPNLARITSLADARAVLYYAHVQRHGGT